jgi:hypothetical protein
VAGRSTTGTTGWASSSPDPSASVPRQTRHTRTTGRGGRSGASGPNSGHHPAVEKRCYSAALHHHGRPVVRSFSSASARIASPSASLRRSRT